MSRTPSWVTPERDDVLRKLYPKYKNPMSKIMAAIRKLPGEEPPSESCLQARARKLGVLRGELHSRPWKKANDEKWTPERDAVVHRMFPIGEQLIDILAAVNALPGPKTSKRMLIRHATIDLGLTRQARVKSPIPSEPTSYDDQDFEPIAANLDTVADWAKQHDMHVASWEDLPRVNSKREQLFLATFKREFRAIGVRST